MLKLLINEKDTQYLELKVSKHVDDLAGSFNVKVLKQINIGNKVQITIANQVLIDGFVDIAKSSLTTKGKSFQISGRDKTGDLVDSCVESSKSYKLEPLIDIAKEYTKDFNIKVVGSAVNVSYTPNPGITIFRALSDLAIQDNLRLVARSGDLYFEKVMVNKKALFSFTEGVNILSISLTDDHRQRFRKYVARTLVQGLSENYDYDEAILDSEIKRKRTLLFTSDKDQEKECIFQKNIRKAKSKIISLVVYGFKHDGLVPDILQQASIISPTLGIKGVYVIVGISFIYNYEQKKLLKLQLADPKAFLEKPENNNKGGW